MTSPRQKVVIFGTGTFGRLLSFYLSVDSEYDVVAFTATADRITGDTFCGKPLVPFESVTKVYPPNEHKMFVAVGSTRLNRVRAHFYHATKALGYGHITYISSKATYWSDLDVGDNCCILEATTLEPFARVGNDVVLWSGSHLGHDSSIDDHCFVASDVVIPGFTHIGQYCFIGVNATLRDGVSVGERCLIGAAATIMRSTGPGEVYLGPRSEAYTGDTSRFDI